MSESNYDTSVIFSKVCVSTFHWESPANRSGSVRTQVNRGRVFHSAWGRVFLAWMDNWALCKASWQRTGPERETTERVKTPWPGLEVVHLPLLQLRHLSLSSGNFQTASGLTRIDSSKPLWSDLLFLPEGARLKVTSVGLPSTSLKLLAPSQTHMK